MFGLTFWLLIAGLVSLCMAAGLTKRWMRFVWLFSAICFLLSSYLYDKGGVTPEQQAAVSLSREVAEAKEQADAKAANEQRLHEERMKVSRYQRFLAVCQNNDGIKHFHAGGDYRGRSLGYSKPEMTCNNGMKATLDEDFK